MNAAWRRKRARQPKIWMSGPPTVNPTTGAPAATIAHHPIALGLR